MQPIVHGLEQKHSNRIDFLYIDREDPANAQIVEQYGIRYQPVYILLDADGNIAQQWFGSVQAEAFEAAFNTLAQ